MWNRGQQSKRLCCCSEGDEGEAETSLIQYGHPLHCCHIHYSCWQTSCYHHCGYGAAMPQLQEFLLTRFKKINCIYRGVLPTSSYILLYIMILTFLFPPHLSPPPTAKHIIPLNFHAPTAPSTVVYKGMGNSSDRQQIIFRHQRQPGCVKVKLDRGRVNCGTFILRGC